MGIPTGPGGSLCLAALVLLVNRERRPWTKVKVKRKRSMQLTVSISHPERELEMHKNG